MTGTIDTSDLVAALTLFGGRYQAISVFTDDLADGALSTMNEGWVANHRQHFRVSGVARDVQCDLALGLLVGEPIGTGTARRIFAVEFDPRTRQWAPYDGALLMWMKERLLAFLAGDAELIDTLYRLVTNAITSAEGLPAGSAAAREAFLVVSELEEKIALVIPARDPEGELARAGAVSAAISANAPLRAAYLAELYLKYAIDPVAAQTLRDLRLRAHLMWALT